MQRNRSIKRRLRYTASVSITCKELIFWPGRDWLKTGIATYHYQTKSNFLIYWIWLIVSKFYSIRKKYILNSHRMSLSAKNVRAIRQGPIKIADSPSGIARLIGCWHYKYRHIKCWLFRKRFFLLLSRSAYSLYLINFFTFSWFLISWIQNSYFKQYWPHARALRAYLRASIRTIHEITCTLFQFFFFNFGPVSISLLSISVPNLDYLII